MISKVEDLWLRVRDALSTEDGRSGPGRAGTGSGVRGSGFGLGWAGWSVSSLVLYVRCVSKRKKRRMREAEVSISPMTV
jgi:hypothetical protein